LRLLLDTHVFLWWIGEDDQLPRPIWEAIGDPNNQALLSAAAAWEIVVKAGGGRLRLMEPPEELLPRGIDRARLIMLPVELRHVLRLASLPPIHADPFDRMLVAQALEDGLTLVTGDPVVQSYGVDFIW